MTKKKDRITPQITETPEKIIRPLPKRVKNVDVEEKNEPAKSSKKKAKPKAETKVEAFVEAFTPETMKDVEPIIEEKVEEIPEPIETKIEVESSNGIWTSVKVAFGLVLLTISFILGYFVAWSGN